MLALLRQSQIAANGHVLTVLRAILTWWTAHFHAYDQLLLIQEHLHIIVYQDAALSSNSKKIIQGEQRLGQQKCASLLRRPFFGYPLHGTPFIPLFLE